MGRVIHPESDPLRVVINSIQVCLAAGYDVQPTGPLGVMVVDKGATRPWGPDLSAGGVTTVIGAVILCRQPPELESMEHVCMLAFGASWRFVAGLMDGLAGRVDEGEPIGKGAIEDWFFGFQIGRLAVDELRGSGATPPPTLDLEDEHFETPRC